MTDPDDVPELDAAWFAKATVMEGRKPRDARHASATDRASRDGEEDGDA